METKTTCYNHPNRETSLRCNRCERPICSECAILTPTGYRCKNCIKSQQKVFDTTFNTAKPLDLVLGPLTAVFLTALGSFISLQCGFYVILIAPVLGWLISEGIRRLVRRRRSHLLFRLVGAGFLLGGLLLPLGILVLFGQSALPELLWPVVYAVLVTISGYSNINISRVIKV